MALFIAPAIGLIMTIRHRVVGRLSSCSKPFGGLALDRENVSPTLVDGMVISVILSVREVNQVWSGLVLVICTCSSPADGFVSCHRPFSVCG